MKIYFIAILLFALSSCVTIENIPEGYEGPVSKVTDTSKNMSSTKAQFYELYKVDGRNVYTSSDMTYGQNQGQGFIMEVHTTGRPVPAIKSTLSIRGLTHNAAPILGIMGGNYKVQGDVVVDLKPDAKYFVKGEMSKEYKAVWIENEAGATVSEKIEVRD